MKFTTVLTIAGSDSGGGAGIQADLKTFAALGCHGTSAITAITAQNTTGVTGIEEISEAMVKAQVEAVVQDLAPVAAKSGMLSSAALIIAVAEAVRDFKVSPLVVDPVMVAKGGARLLQEDAVGALKEHLLPLAAVVTPNIPEAEVLVGHPIRTRREREVAALEILSLGPKAVVVKGGHAEEDADDVLAAGGDTLWLPAMRVSSTNTHGSGCTFSAAIAARLAHGRSLEEAVREAKEFTLEAIRRGLEVGSGTGPVNQLLGWRTGFTD